MANAEMTVGDRLYELRKDSGLSIAKLSGLTGCSTGGLASYEKGTQLPGYVALNALADFYGVSLDYLFGKEENQKRDNINIGARIGLSDTAIAALEAHKKIETPIDSARLNIPWVLNTMLENDKFCMAFFPNFLMYFDTVAREKVFQALKDKIILNENTDMHALYYLGMTQALDCLLKDTADEADTVK